MERKQHIKMSQLCGLILDGARLPVEAKKAAITYAQKLTEDTALQSRVRGAFKSDLAERDIRRAVQVVAKCGNSGCSDPGESIVEYIKRQRQAEPAAVTPSVQTKPLPLIRWKSPALKWAEKWAVDFPDKARKATEMYLQQFKTMPPLDCDLYTYYMQQVDIEY